MRDYENLKSGAAQELARTISLSSCQLDGKRWDAVSAAAAVAFDDDDADDGK